MRFRDHLIAAALTPAWALTGCALIDAAGEDDGARLSFDQVNVPNTSQTPRAVAIGELDRVAGQDLVVLDQSGRLLACMQSQNLDGRTFDCAQVSSTSYNQLAVDDLNGDGGAEVIAAASGILDVWFVSAGRTLSLRTPGCDATGVEPTAIVTGDLPISDTGQRSIAVATTSTTILLCANPMTTPMRVTATATNGPGPEPRAIGIGDTKPTDSRAELIFSDGSALVEATGPTLFARHLMIPGASARVLAIGEYGSAMQADVAFFRPSFENSDIAFFYGSPTGLFDPLVSIGRGSAASQLATGDFDDDGNDDLVALDIPGGERRLTFYLQTAPGAFAALPIVPNASPASFAVGRLDADESDDLALIPGAEGGVDVLLSE